MTTAGRWTLGAVIARHAYARVHLTDDPYLMISVLERDADAHDLEAMIAEPRSYNDRSAGMVIDIVDAGAMADGALYLAMELVPGKLLMELLFEQARSAPEIVTRFGVDLLEGLAAIHGRGISHGELRPTAVAVARDGRPRILHVGVAVLRTTRNRRLQLEGGMRGWAPYYSPERIRDAPPDPRTDVYGVGTILYELATGVPAFDGDSAYAMLNAHLTGTVVRPRERVPELPEGLDRVIMRALERDPANRFASADEMRAALLA